MKNRKIFYALNCLSIAVALNLASARSLNAADGPAEKTPAHTAKSEKTDKAAGARDQAAKDAATNNQQHKEDQAAQQTKDAAKSSSETQTQAGNVKPDASAIPQLQQDEIDDPNTKKMQSMDLQSTKLKSVPEPDDHSELNPGQRARIEAAKPTSTPKPSPGIYRAQRAQRQQKAAQNRQSQTTTSKKTNNTSSATSTQSTRGK